MFDDQDFLPSSVVTPAEENCSHMQTEAAAVDAATTEAAAGDAATSEAAAVDTVTTEAAAGDAATSEAAAVDAATEAAAIPESGLNENNFPDGSPFPSLRPEEVGPFPRFQGTIRNRKRQRRPSILTSTENLPAEPDDQSTCASTSTNKKRIYTTKSKMKTKPTTSEDTVCVVCDDLYSESLCEWLKCTNCAKWVCESCFGTNMCFMCT